MSKCTYIDGIASSQCLDTAGEIVDLQGLDCTTLIGAALNWEHLKDQPSQICGKILEYKKIFSEKDCENDRHLFYWNKCQIPYLYIMGRLFDDKKPSAIEVAALFKDDAEHPDEQDMLGFSIEGAKIEKINQVITKSIARKVTLTALPANKSCIAEMIPTKQSNESNQKDNLDSIFKSEPKYEIELFKFEEDTQLNNFLKKKENMNKQLIPTGTPSSPGGLMENSEIKKASSNWSSAKVKNNAVHYSHPEHGTVSIHKQPNGEFHVKHQGTLAGLKGKKGVFSSAKEAGNHAKQYMQALGSDKLMSPKMHDRPSPQMPAKMGKALDAGSAMAAPSQLSGGAALGKENLGKKSKKTTWLMRAEDEYNKWEKKEEFRNFMKKKLPKLAMGEIDAIGKTLALSKSLKMEKAISRLNPAYEEQSKMHSTISKFDDAVMGTPMANKEKMAKDSDIMMASEEWQKHPKTDLIHTKKYSTGQHAEINRGFPGLSGKSRVTINGEHNYDVPGSLEQVKSHADKLVHNHKK